jgi:hypothetical protein
MSCIAYLIICECCGQPRQQLERSLCSPIQPQPKIRLTLTAYLQLQESMYYPYPRADFTRIARGRQDFSLLKGFVRFDKITQRRKRELDGEFGGYNRVY